MILKVIISGLLTSLIFANCTISNLRASQLYNSNGREFVIVNNLQSSIALELNREDLKKHIDVSFKDKNYSFNIDFKTFICDYYKNPKKMGSTHLEDFNRIYPAKKPLKQQVAEASLINIPLAYSLPSIDIMAEIPGEFIDIPQIELDIFKSKLVDLVTDLNLLTSQANTLLFPSFLLQYISDLGIRSLSRDQIFYVISQISDYLSSNDLQFLTSLIEKIDGIYFIQKDFGLKIVLRTLDPVIHITAEDLYLPEHSYQEIKGLFNFVDISDGASFSYYTSGNSKLSIDITGVKASGKLPIIGDILFKPLKVSFDRKSNTPAMVKIRAEKGISIEHTVDIDF